MDGEGILLSAIAAASIVVFGAFYALLFALGRLHSSLALQRAAWVAYGFLAASTVVLARTMELRGGWLWIVAVMLLGYLLAPYAIWHLSAATHAGADARAGNAETVER